MCASAIATAILLSGSFANAQPSKRECVALNEAGQELRQSGKFYDARARFEACAVSGCPAVLRDDCVARLGDVTRAMPSVKLTVKDARGRVVRPRRVILDGKDVTVDSSDGIATDPGEHNLDVEAEGFAPTRKTFVAREGAKRHEEVVHVDDLARDVTSAERADASPSPRRLVALGVGGAGIALVGIGAYFGLAAKSTYDDASSLENCPQGPSSCNTAGIDGGRRADEQATISTVTFIAGALFLAGGLVVYVTAPEKRTVQVAPSVGRTATGIAATVTW